MANEQSGVLTIFDAYGNMLAAQFAFAQRIMRANAKMFNLWIKTPGAVAEDERPSVAALKPEVMTG